MTKKGIDYDSVDVILSQGEVEQVLRKKLTEIKNAAHEVVAIQGVVNQKFHDKIKRIQGEIDVFGNIIQDAISDDAEAFLDLMEEINQEIKNISDQSKSPKNTIEITHNEDKKFQTVDKNVRLALYQVRFCEDMNLIYDLYYKNDISLDGLCYGDWQSILLRVEEHYGNLSFLQKFFGGKNQGKWVNLIKEQIDLQRKIEQTDKEKTADLAGEQAQDKQYQKPSVTTAGDNKKINVDKEQSFNLKLQEKYNSNKSKIQNFITRNSFPVTINEQNWQDVHSAVLEHFGKLRFRTKVWQYIKTLGVLILIDEQILLQQEIKK